MLGISLRSRGFLGLSLRSRWICHRAWCMGRKPRWSPWERRPGPARTARRAAGRRAGCGSGRGRRGLQLLEPCGGERADHPILELWVPAGARRVQRPSSGRSKLSTSFAEPGVGL